MRARASPPAATALIASALAIFGGCSQSAEQRAEPTQGVSPNARAVSSSLAAADRASRLVAEPSLSDAMPMGPAPAAQQPLDQSTANTSGPFRAGTNAYFLEQAALQKKIDEAEEQLWALTSEETPSSVEIEAQVRLIARGVAQRRMAFIRAAARGGM